jgi:hypothetical protein
MMAKKKRGKKPKKRKMVKVDPKNYEVAQYGPLKMERMGRYVSLSSEWEPREFEKHIENIKANREPFRQEINEAIRELITIAEQYNPLELLSTVATQNVFANPETYKESTHEGRESYVEYALSVALSVKNPRMDVHATSEAIERVNTLIAKIFNNVGWFFGMEAVDEEDRTKHEIRYHSLMRYLMVRGDSYPEHHIDLVKSLFEPHNNFLKEHYGFITHDVILWLENIEAQVLAALNRQGAFAAKMHEMHEIFKRFIDEQGADAFSSMEECMEAYNLLPEVQTKRKEIEEDYEKLDYIIFEIKPSDELPRSFLDLISSGFGDNEAFASFEKSPGWPTNDSLIYRRPLISHDGRYYCFASQILYRNLISLLEAFIREKDTAYFDNTYQKVRGRFLVRKALEYLETLLPEANIYEELYYPTIINGQVERAETDGIVLFDTNIFIIEGKAGSFTTPARRGALSRLKRNVTELVDEAYKQALRTKLFISETEKPRFEYENGSEALVIENKQIFKNIYFINVTLENLGHLSAHLNSLKNLNLIKGKEWPWSVFLNDLRIISEISETPSEFLVYLQRRLRANDYPQFHTGDELDFFMFYLYEGLYFEDDRLKNLDVFSPHAYTADLDRYYDHKAGRVSSGEKPRLKVPEDYKTFIRNIEATGKQGFSEVTTALLGFDVKTMEAVLSNIEQAKQRSVSEGKDQDFTLVFSSSNLGLTVSVCSNRKEDSIKKASDYCVLKMYQLKLSKWIFLAVNIKDDAETYDFRVFQKEWSHNPSMEEKLKQYRKQKIDQFLASGRKPRRNDPCPCNGGLKYKKCCANEL